MDPQIFARLSEIRQYIRSQYASFIDITCHYAATKVAGELGMEVVDGYFKDEFGRKLPHHWNYNPGTGEIVDLTAVQFESGLPHILVIPADSAAARKMYERDDAAGEC
jgi:hypothetical protein